MKKKFISLLLIVGAIAINASSMELTTSSFVESTSEQSQRNVVFRKTQSEYSSEAKEWLYFYSNGTVSVANENSGTRYTGTYSMVDGRSGLTINIEGNNVYCRIQLDRAGNLVSLTFKGYKYIKR